MGLSNKQIAELQPRAKAFKMHDAKGLFVQVLPSGTKSFFLRRNGKERRLGRFPAMSLKDARVEAERDRRADTSLPTFREVSKDYLATWAPKRRDAFTFYNECRLRDLADLMDLRLDEITVPLLRRELLKVRERSPHTAHRLRGLADRIFSHAYEMTGVAAANPAKALTKSFAIEAHERGQMGMIDPARVHELWQAINEYGGHVITKAALKMTFWTVLRPASLLNARWSWLNEAGDVLTIPKEFMKTRRPFRVPLCRQARDELAGLGTLSSTIGLILEAPFRRRAISSDTLRLALQVRMGFEEQTVHAIRALFSTIMNKTREAGQHTFGADLIEAAFSHTLPKVRGAYMRTDYLEERRALMEVWADYLEGLPFPRKHDAVAKALQEANRLKRVEKFMLRKP